jgi:hypothetical protein
MPHADNGHVEFVIRQAQQLDRVAQHFFLVSHIFMFLPTNELWRTRTREIA